MGKPHILWKHVEKSIDCRYDEGKETKGKTTKEVEEQRQGNLEEIGADWEQAYDGDWRVVEGNSFGGQECKLLVRSEA